MNIKEFISQGCSALEHRLNQSQLAIEPKIHIYFDSQLIDLIDSLKWVVCISQNDMVIYVREYIFKDRSRDTTEIENMLLETCLKEFIVHSLGNMHFELLKKYPFNLERTHRSQFVKF